MPATKHAGAFHSAPPKTQGRPSTATLCTVDGLACPSKTKTGLKLSPADRDQIYFETCMDRAEKASTCSFRVHRQVKGQYPICQSHDFGANAPWFAFRLALAAALERSLPKLGPNSTSALALFIMLTS